MADISAAHFASTGHFVSIVTALSSSLCVSVFLLYIRRVTARWRNNVLRQIIFILILVY